MKNKQNPDRCSNNIFQNDVLFEEIFSATFPRAFLFNWCAFLKYLVLVLIFLLLSTQLPTFFSSSLCLVFSKSIYSYLFPSFFVLSKRHPNKKITNLIVKRKCGMIANEKSIQSANDGDWYLPHSICHHGWHAV